MKYIKVRLSDFQRGNLKKLADYLLGGYLASGFSMVAFDYGMDREDVTHCGSSGCAVGHGPYAGIEKYKTEDWANYSYRCFINSKENFEYYLAWEWCFSAEWFWRRIDNTAEGAGKRIKILIEKGIPSEWYDQKTMELLDLGEEES
jgi:hypothetical protein